MTLSTYFMEATYLIASILFVFALKGMSHPETARRGMFLAEGGMLAAIIGTLIGTNIVTWVWIIAGLSIGSIIGAWMAIWVPMTAMPQRTALSHAFGALAAALVGVGEFLVHANEMPGVTRAALGFEVILGALTTTGSLIAAGKLQGIIHGKRSGVTENIGEAARGRRESSEHSKRGAACGHRFHSNPSHLMRQAEITDLASY